MLALIAKMLVCLLIAAAIGFLMGWLIRGLRGSGTDPQEVEDLRRDLVERGEEVSRLETERATQAAELVALRAQPDRVSDLEAELASTRTAWDADKLAAAAAASAAAAALAATRSSLADQEQAYADLEARHRAGAGLPIDEAASRQRILQLDGELAVAQAASVGMTSLRSELDAARQALAELQGKSDGGEEQAATITSLTRRVQELEADLESLRESAGQTGLQLQQCTQARTLLDEQLASVGAERATLAAQVLAFEKAEKLRRAKPPRQYWTPPAQVDDLEWIYGVGPKLAEMLNKLGIYQFRQVAMWNEEEIEYFDRHLEQFHGRIRRENWVLSAREEHYKKYGEWLGDGDPTVSMPETGNRPQDGDPAA